MPLDGIDSDDRADEVYCDPNRNDNPEHPSFKEYTDERFFYVNNSCVVFSSPVEAGTPTTSNSNNTRTELREMPADCSGEAGWDATTPGKKTLEFKVKVLETSSTRKFAFAQIHDFKQDIWDDLLRIQIQSDKPFAKPGDTGRIYILGDVTEGELTDGFPKDFRAEYYADRYILNDYVLGEELHVKVEMENSIMKIFLNDMNTPVRTYTGLECKSNYYKVGVYNQSVKADSTGNGVAEFCEIKVSDNF